MGQRGLIGIGVAVALLAGGCARLAMWSAPAKAPSAERTAAARSADDLFWRTLHGGGAHRAAGGLSREPARRGDSGAYRLGAHLAARRARAARPGAARHHRRGGAE